MSESKKTQLLGKKRELEKKSEEEEEENELSKNKQKKLENVDNKDLEKKSDESSESSHNEPKQSLFGKNEKGFSGGLFGDLDNPKKTTSLFDKPEEGGTSLFSNTGGNLFGNINSETKTSNSGGLFSGNLFDFSQINKKKEDEDKNDGEEDGGEENNNIGKSNSPKHEYNPENDANDKPDKDGYIKRYIKKVDNALLYEKLKNTFVSRGEGFIIIETQEKEKEDKKKERFARILFRNSIGGIIFQGVLNDQIHKCVCTEKKLKHICHFIFLFKEDEKTDLSLGQAKIPFTTLEEINKFSEIYNKTIKYLHNEIDDF